jgi:D-beta-D-heptose 7-phosphate kinase / D-beta-D-heptose 1-phosphate adenosyltransferase
MSQHFLKTKFVPSRSAMKLLSQKYKRSGKRVVFTNGCFDILHRGHIVYLNEAKSLGDILVVGVNTDASVRCCKGDKRPVNPLKDRLLLLAALECVDHVVAFGERLPNEIIKVVRPDIHVKGGDYTVAQLPEARVVEELGGKVIILPRIKNCSTTDVIGRILKTYIGNSPAQN